MILKKQTEQNNYLKDLQKATNMKEHAVYKWKMLLPWIKSFYGTTF